MPEVSIVLKTIDESSKPTKKVKEEFQSLSPALEKAGKGIAGFVSANATLIATVTGVGVAVGKAYQEFQNYAGQVRDLALVSGTGAEEASRLLQVLDDYQISAQDVTAATRAMTKEGLTPSIDTLAKLSDQYLQINDAQARNEFIIKNLGRSGLQWVNVLQQGSDAIREQSGEVSKSLILNDEMIEKAEKERLAMDALADAWQGFKVQVGAAVGAMVLANKETKDMAEEYQKLTGQMAFTGNHVPTEDFERYTKQIEKAEAMTKFYNTQIQNTSEIIDGEVVPSLEELSKHNADIINSAIDIADSQKAFQEEQSETTSKIAEYQAKLAELFPWETEKRQEILDQIGELEQQYQNDATAFEEATNRKLAMMTIEKIAMLDNVAGYSAAEQEKAFAILETLGVAESAAAREAVAMDAVTTAIANGELKARDMKEALELLSTGKYNIEAVLNIVTQVTGALPGANPQAQQGGYGYAAANPGYAEGGISSGSKSGHWELLHGTEAVIPLKNGSVPVQMQGGNSASSSDTMAMVMPLIQRMGTEMARAVSNAIEKSGRR